MSIVGGYSRRGPRSNGPVQSADIRPSKRGDPPQLQAEVGPALGFGLLQQAVRRLVIVQRIVDESALGSEQRQSVRVGLQLEPSGQLGTRAQLCAGTRGKQNKNKD